MTNRITEQEAQEMQERCDKATPGEWVLMGHSGVYELPDVVRSDGDCLLMPDSCGATICYDEIRSNLEFVSHARTDLPRLLSERTALLERERVLLGIVRDVMNQEPTHVDQLFHRCSICHSVLSEPGIANYHTTDCPYRRAQEFMAQDFQRDNGRALEVK